MTADDTFATWLRANPSRKCVLRVMGFANGMPCLHAGEFVMRMDFEAYDGRGYLETTSEIDKAKLFDNKGEAFEFLRTISKTRPRRTDGKPNRPLTSAHVLIVDVGADDFGRSIDEVYAEIRNRVAAGGEGWKPK